MKKRKKKQQQQELKKFYNAQVIIMWIGRVRDIYIHVWWGYF